MATYFYMRISTKEEQEKQTLNRQMKALERYAAENNLLFDSHTIFKEEKSAKNFKDRAEWIKLEKILHEGDTVVFKDLSRFSRAAEEGYAKYMALMNKGITLIFLDNMTISTDNVRHLLDVADENSQESKTFLMQTFDEFKKFMIKILIVSELDRAERERLLISQRTKDGMIVGRKPGRKEGTMEKLNKELEQDIMCYLDDRSVMQVDIMRKHDISRNTLKKYAKLLSEQRKNDSEK